jgi:hypothetical protein
MKILNNRKAISWLFALVVNCCFAFAGTSSEAWQTNPLVPQGVYTQDQIDYFLEIALGSEFGRASAVVRKWTRNIRIKTIGSPTNEDRMTLNRVIEDINAIIGRTQLKIDEQRPDVEIYFVPESDFTIYEPNYRPTNFGFFWIWWNRSSEIVRARIMISTDRITQKERSHLIREELTQILGLMKDSWAYKESIFYQGWTATTTYAEIDKVSIEILYRSEILPGMTRRQVEEVLLPLKLNAVAVEQAGTQALTWGRIKASK